MTKTVAELRNEIKEEQIGVIVGLAKDNIKEIDKKIIGDIFSSLLGDKLEAIMVTWRD